MSLGKTGRRGTYLDDGGTIPESGLEEDIGIGKQALFERDDDKLTAFESVFEKLSDVLGMLQIEGRINLVKNVHRCRLELE